VTKPPKLVSSVSALSRWRLSGDPRLGDQSSSGKMTGLKRRRVNTYRSACAADVVYSLAVKLDAGSLQHHKQARKIDLADGRRYATSCTGH
jgi:hypothetical protein